MHIDQLSDLYWLAYLLTGDRERSIQAVIGTLDMEDDASPFFESWMSCWSRKIFIAKVLGAATPQMKSSPRLRPVKNSALRSFDTIDRAKLEQALLAIDQFPRCALLLTVFEKLSIEDTATLLNADSKVVKAARAVALAELAGNLNKSPDRAPAPPSRALQELIA